MKTKLLFLVLLTFVTNECFSSTVATSVVFGTKTATGPAGSGRGIAKALAAEATLPGSIKVTFESSADNDTLVLSFSLGELAVNQLSQVSYFTNPSKTYSFENEYQLTDPIYASLNLMPNAKILPTSPASFRINGDMVKLSIKYAHNSAQTAMVTFGTRPYASGGCVGRGIFKVAAKNATSSPEAILVHFATNPDNDTLQMTFSLNELIHKQVRQVSDFADTTHTYTFENVYSLTEPIFTALNLQPNAKITPTSPTVIKIMGDSVRLYVKYAHNSTILASVTFGSKPAAGGQGKGVANILPNDAQPNPEAVRVNFNVNPDNDTLTMVFSLKEMMNRQLRQLGYFASPSGTYSFDEEYLLSGTVYAPLNLPPNAKISRKSPSTFSVSGDEVRLCIAYAHD